MSLLSGFDEVMVRMDGGEQPTPTGPQDWVYHVAAQLAATELPSRGPAPDEPRRRRRWLLPALLAGGLAIGAVVVVVLTRDDGGGTGSPSTTQSPATLASVVPTAAPGTTVGVTTTSAGATTTTTAAAVPSVVETTTAVVTTLAATTTLPADPNASPVRWAEYADGVVTLRGRVPDQATADEIAGKAAQVVGADNVRVEYTIDPGAPKPDFAPLYVNSSILFGPDEATLNAKARDTLDLAVTLLTLFPRVTFDIEGHTDAEGSDAANLALSQRRVDAIVSYLVDRGVDGSRLTAVAKGEAEPIADNATPAGRAQNRRIEIQVNNLIG